MKNPTLKSIPSNRELWFSLISIAGGAFIGYISNSWIGLMLMAPGLYLWFSGRFD